MSRYQDATDPTSKSLSPDTLKRQAPKRANTVDAIRESEAVYLRNLMDSNGDYLLALKASGYSPTSRESAAVMHRQICDRIDQITDYASVMRAAGMGFTRWLETLGKLANCGDPKYMAVALKLWGIPLGVYTPQQGSAGANINVNVLQANSSADTPTNGLVQVVIDARKPLPASETALPVDHLSTESPLSELES